MTDTAIRPATAEQPAQRCCCCSRSRCWRSGGWSRWSTCWPGRACCCSLRRCCSPGARVRGICTSPPRSPFVLKVVFLPWLLHRLIRRLDVYWDTEPLINIAGTMLIGLLIVIFAFGLAQPIAALASTATRNALGIALAVVLLAFLMMITRRKAMSPGGGLPVDGERPVLRRDERHLRHADGRRAGHRARRAGGDAGARRVLLPDPRAVRQPRSASPRTLKEDE